jgi:hypothetical protein
MIYLQMAGRDEVFITRYDMVASLFDINPLSVVDRFVALIDIRDCERIEIHYPSVPARNFDIFINHGHDGERDTIEPTINRQKVDDSAFRGVYRLLIGLTSDVEIEPFEPQGEPVFTITYTLIDKPPVHIRYYEYETNFYAMARDGELCLFVTSRQSTEQFFKGIEELLNP